MTAIRALPQLESTSPYVAYAYSYPHKSAYRPLTPRRSLREAWRDEARDQLFLYTHIPFCEMRCGFCNLFTTANPRATVVSQYIDTLERQARIVRDALGPGTQISRMAIGGGTPTYLSPDELRRVLRIAHDVYGVTPDVPCSVETSPRTTSTEKLAVLREFGVSRISIGVQSFVEAEVQSSERAQKNEWVARALDTIRSLEFPTLNLDLIYGLPGQTVESWARSLDHALQWRPEELYLYPLYVRPLTGLGRHGAAAHDQLRLACYREATARLASAGYEQVSMRMFRRSTAPRADAGPHYCCQDDGMVGLGCGARSYTTRLHYSSEYAVSSGGVKQIIEDYIHRSDDDFACVDYGCDVTEPEQRRRWLIKSLFRTEGLDRRAYADHFGTDPMDEFPELVAMAERGYFDVSDATIRPTALGLEWSDALAPMLFSDDVLSRSDEFELR